MGKHHRDNIGLLCTLGWKVVRISAWRCSIARPIHKDRLRLLSGSLLTPRSNMKVPDFLGRLPSMSKR